MLEREMKTIQIPLEVAVLHN